MGSNGRDNLTGGTGDDTIISGPGDDKIYGYGGYGWSFYDENDAFLKYKNYFLGDESNDDDIIFAGSGDDEVIAEFGDDLVYGSAGIDTLYGMGGNDILFGGDGVDILVGDETFIEDPKFARVADYGDDFLDGGRGEDTLYGDGGNDVLYGGDGGDILLGDADDLEGIYHGDDYLDGGEGIDTLKGGGGNDVLYGGTGVDHLYGDGSPFPGYDGADYLDGGAGDDFLYGNAMGDTLIGGAGNDELYGESLSDAPQLHGDDILYGGSGEDKLVGVGGNDTLYGGADNDTLAGDADNLSAEYHGNDTLYGGAGDDELIGHGGDDTLFGGSGFDKLFGDGGTFQGNDTLNGGTGNDELVGGPGDDILRGGADEDVLWGGIGYDTLEGGRGLDILYGGFGNDTLDGGMENDGLAGGEGDDTYLFRRGSGFDVIYDEAGSADTLEFIGLASTEARVKYRSGGIEISFNTTDTYSSGTSFRIANTPYTGSNTQPDGDVLMIFDGLEENHKIESLKFSDGVEWTPDYLRSRIGEFSLIGLESSFDIVLGNNGGYDILDLSPTNVVVNGQNRLTRKIITNAQRSGDDLVLDVEVVSGGNNSPVASGQLRLKEQYGETGNIEEFVEPWFGLNTKITKEVALEMGGKYFQYFNADQNYNQFQPNTPYSGVYSLLYVGTENGEEIIQSSAATTPTSLYGLGGDDTLTANSGDDTLYGGAGNDTLYGKNGNDTYYINPFEYDVVYDAGTGGLDISDAIVVPDGINLFDLNFSRNGDDLSINNMLIQSYFYVDPNDSSTPYKVEYIEYNGRRIDMDSMLLANGFYDAINSAVAGEVTYGDTGGNLIVGLDGGEQLYGGDGNDVLRGMIGNDRLFGENGDDILIGGEGSDFLQGGIGNDIYVYSRGDGDDSIVEGGRISSYADMLLFTDVTPEDILLKQLSNGLEITIPGTEDRVTLSQWAPTGSGKIEHIGFSDGTMWSSRTSYSIGIRSHINITAATGNDDFLFGQDENNIIFGELGNDTIGGREGDDILLGGAGIDDIEGGAGNDIIAGGLGGDRVAGGTGDDVYLFNAGDGNTSGLSESINEGTSSIESSSALLSTSSIDTLSFGGGIDPADVNAYFSSYQNTDGTSARNLYLELSSTGEKVVVPWYSVNINWDIGSEIFTHFDGRIERLQFLGTDNDRIFDLEALINARLSDLTTVATYNTLIPLFTPDALQNFDVTQSEGLVGGDVAYLYATGDVIALNNYQYQYEYGTINDDVLSGTNTNDAFYTLAGNDTVDGGAGSDQYNGGAGLDTLGSKTGDDFTSYYFDQMAGLYVGNQYIGGTGNDTLNGSQGSDTYTFNVGDGMDVINEIGGLSGSGYIDIIKLGIGITEADVTLTREKNITDFDLLIN